MTKPGDYFVFSAECNQKFRTCDMAAGMEDAEQAEEEGLQEER